MNKQRRWILQGGLALSGTQLLSGSVALGVDGPEPSTEVARFDAMRHTVSLAMGEVAYATGGSGRTVLLLHGFPLNSFQWRDVIARLAPHARCVAPDFLGMGQSIAKPGQDVGPVAQSQMLVELLDALDVPKADVIANDSGCAVAQLLMTRHADRVRSVLLTNGDTEHQCPPAAMAPVIDLSKQGRFVDEWLAPWQADPALARSEKGIGGLCYENRAHPTDDALRVYFDALVASAERKAALHAYAAALEHNVLAGIGPALRASRVPARVVWGTGDTIFDAADADYLQGVLGNSRGVRRLPGAKLFWPEERPDVIAAQARMLWQHAPA